MRFESKKTEQEKNNDTHIIFFLLEMLEHKTLYYLSIYAAPNSKIIFLLESVRKYHLLLDETKPPPFVLLAHAVNASTLPGVRPPYALPFEGRGIGQNLVACRRYQFSSGKTKNFSRFHMSAQPAPRKACEFINDFPPWYLFMISGSCSPGKQKASTLTLSLIYQCFPVPAPTILLLFFCLILFPFRIGIYSHPGLSSATPGQSPPYSSAPVCFSILHPDIKCFVLLSLFANVFLVFYGSAFVLVLLSLSCILLLSVDILATYRHMILTLLICHHWRNDCFRHLSSFPYVQTRPNNPFPILPA